MPLADRELFAGAHDLPNAGLAGMGEVSKLPVLVPFKLPGCRAGPLPPHHYARPDPQAGRCPGQSPTEMRRSAVKRTPQVDTTLPESPAGLLAALGAALGGPGQLRSRATDRLAMGHDASHFALTPSV